MINLKPKFTFKRDLYQEARGGHSRLINIYCRKCKQLIAVYQKDGSGNLRRMYLDRIYSPLSLTNLQCKPLGRISILNCSKCKEILGTPTMYQKENRKVFRLYQDAIIKSVRKLN
jgi:ribosomal protein S27E